MGSLWGTTRAVWLKVLEGTAEVSCGRKNLSDSTFVLCIVDKEVHAQKSI